MESDSYFTDSDLYSDNDPSDNELSYYSDNEPVRVRYRSRVRATYPVWTASSPTIEACVKAHGDPLHSVVEIQSAATPITKDMEWANVPSWKCVVDGVSIAYSNNKYSVLAGDQTLDDDGVSIEGVYCFREILNPYSTDDKQKTTTRWFIQPKQLIKCTVEQNNEHKMWQDWNSMDVDGNVVHVQDGDRSTMPEADEDSLPNPTNIDDLEQTRTKVASSNKPESPHEVRRVLRARKLPLNGLDKLGEFKYVENATHAIASLQVDFATEALQIQERKYGQWRDITDTVTFGNITMLNSAYGAYSVKGHGVRLHGNGVMLEHVRMEVSILDAFDNQRREGTVKWIDAYGNTVRFREYKRGRLTGKVWERWSAPNSEGVTIDVIRECMYSEGRKGLHRFATRSDHCWGYPTEVEYFANGDREERMYVEGELCDMKDYEKIRPAVLVFNKEGRVIRKRYFQEGRQISPSFYFYVAQAGLRWEITKHILGSEIPFWMWMVLLFFIVQIMF